MKTQRGDPFTKHATDVPQMKAPLIFPQSSITSGAEHYLHLRKLKERGVWTTAQGRASHTHENKVAPVSLIRSLLLPLLLL